MAGDQPAALTVSYAVYVAFDSMMSGMWCEIAVRYGARSVESRVREAVIFTTVVSVL